MENPERAPAAPRRIVGALESRGNAGLLRDALPDGYHVSAAKAEGAGDELSGFDLAIVDPGGLQRHREAIVNARERAAPVVLPVLLLVEAARAQAGPAQRELGTAVDDIVRLPTTRAELRARVDNLLRLRSLSRELQARYERADRALQGATRALRTLNACNEVLIRATAEDQLLEQVCQVIVDEEGYALAWVGFVHEQADPPWVGAKVAAGPGADFISSMRVDRARFGEGPVWQAIDSGDTRIAADLPADPGVASAAERVREYGLGSAITLPIRPANGAPGVLAIYGGQIGEFDAEEQALLERLAANVEFGINALRADREREHQKAAIEEMAYTDALTGLSNRNHLVERLDELLRTADIGVAVLFVDLDQFKIINDALGHAAGDDVLCQVAQRLRQVIREGDLLARQGGDEFIVVMAEEPRSRERRDAVAEPGGLGTVAEDLAQRLVARLREPLVIQGYERRLGASIGVSLYPDHASGAEELIDHADTAMYAAKHGDTHVCQYSELISRVRQRRLSMEARLHQALETEAFRLHYQPVFDLASGEIQGAEALLRWIQPDGSEVSPGEFMPVAEETDLIVALGAWVLQTAAQQQAEWLDRGLDLRMAVNLSVRQLRDRDGPTELARLARQYVRPEAIELELTEGALVDESRAVEQAVQELHEYGFRIAIDDFGTGYSSLSRLQELPIDTLKIDKSFVADLGATCKGHVIARTIQRLADNLDMQALAEGVETEAQRETLLGMGCRLGQGFLMSGAVPASELVRIVADRPLDRVPGD